MPGRASDPRLAASVPSASLRSSSARPSTSASPCGLRPSPVFALPHPRCPHHCGHPSRRLRQRASHVCHRRLQHWPPLGCRGGPPVSTSPALPVTLPCRAAARSRAFGRWRSRCAHGSPPSAALPHSCRPPRFARSVRHSPKGCAVIDCHRHVLPSARTPLHGPRRRGPASRLPCATRRRGPSPLLRTGPSCPLHLAGARCRRLCRRLRQRASHVCRQRLRQ